MAEARDRQQWNHTSEVIAMIANTFRDPKKRRKPFTGRDFNPWRQSANQEPRAHISDVITRLGLRQPKKD